MQEKYEYEHLEGKEIILIDKFINKGNPLKCIVAGCDKYIGLSIVLNEDIEDNSYRLKKGIEIYCLHGVSSHHRELFESHNKRYNELYDNAFDVLVSEIIDGTVTSDIDELLDWNSMGFGDVQCSFQ